MRISRWAPSPALVIACIALGVSLGGVGYAAVKIPRGSVGTPQLKANAVTGAKVKKDTLTGQDIDESTLKGLMAKGAVAAENGTPSFMYTEPDATEADLSETTITLAKPGKIFVLGRVTATLACKVDGACITVYALFVDGDVAHGSQTALFAEASETADSERLTMFAVSPTLPAGQHTITMKNSTTHPFIQSQQQTSRSLVAVAIGG
jgi:hypothetical protein